MDGPIDTASMKDAWCEADGINERIPLKVLSAEERAALEALGETLLPGAKDAGLAHYIDQQLSVDPSECLLIARALGVIPPYANFYRAGLAALDQSCEKAHGVKFAALAPEKRSEFLRRAAPHFSTDVGKTLFCLGQGKPVLKLGV